MRPLAAVLLGLYVYVIGSLTLGSPSAVERAFVMTDRFYAMSEAQANVALFVPAGALLAVVLLRPALAAALCVLGSTAIEWTQRSLPLGRVADLHDVVHNGFGAVVGAVAVVPLVWLLRRQSRPARGAVTRPPAPLRRPAGVTARTPDV